MKHITIPAIDSCRIVRLAEGRPYLEGTRWLVRFEPTPARERWIARSDN